MHAGPGAGEDPVDGEDRREAVVATNLTGLAHCVAAVLPGMHERRDGQVVVVVSSRAAVQRSPGAGAAYRMSKAGAGYLVTSLNDDLHAEGVRATHRAPGTSPPTSSTRGRRCPTPRRGR